LTVSGNLLLLTLKLLSSGSQGLFFATGSWGSWRLLRAPGGERRLSLFTAKDAKETQRPRESGYPVLGIRVSGRIVVEILTSVENISLQENYDSLRQGIGYWVSVIRVSVIRVSGRSEAEILTSVEKISLQENYDSLRQGIGIGLFGKTENTRL
jgi:hypothetical protein